MTRNMGKPGFLFLKKYVFITDRRVHAFHQVCPRNQTQLQAWWQGHLPTEPSCQPKSKFSKGDLCHISIEFSFKPLAPQNCCNPDFLVVIGS